MALSTEGYSNWVSVSTSVKAGNSPMCFLEYNKASHISKLESECSITLIHITVVQSEAMRLNRLHYQKPPESEFQGWCVPPTRGLYLKASHPSLKMLLPEQSSTCP